MLTNADISVLQDFKIRTFAEEPKKNSKFKKND